MPKCYVIGIDGGSWNYINRFLHELPNLRYIIKRGSAGPLESTIPPLTASAWASYLTGANPGKHGVFDFFRKEGYSIRVITSRDKKVLGLENILSLNKKKVGLINVPLTYPPYEVNGIVYSGFPMPEEKRNHTYPKHLLNEIYKELGAEIRTQPRVFYSRNTAEEFVEDILFTHQSLLKISEYLMSNYNFDFYSVVFGATDALSHAFYSCIGGFHPFYKASECRKYSKCLLDVYKSIDKYIGAIIKQMDNNDLLIVMSDHGFGELRYTIFINNWLKELGLLKFKNNPATRLKMFLHNSGFTMENAYTLISNLRLHSYFIKSQFSNSSSQKVSFLNTIKNKLFLSFSDVDWKNTKAFGVGTFGQIYINLRGREPTGIVNSGEEYNELVNYLIDELKFLKNPLTGEKMFDLIFRKDEIYSGKYLKYAPDIIFLDSTCKHVTNRGFEFGSNNLLTTHVLSWTGTHNVYDGILFVYGDTIKKRYLVNDAKVIDLAPTILHYFNIPIPKYMDGRARLDIFEDASVVARRIPKYSDTILFKFHISNVVKKLRRRLNEKKHNNNS